MTSWWHIPAYILGALAVCGVLLLLFRWWLEGTFMKP